MRLEAMAVQIPYVDKHPNRVAFEGVLTVVNAASDKAPSGARGHRVMLTREAAEKAPDFRERTYHDRLLAFGSPPMRELRWLLGRP